MSPPPFALAASTLASLLALAGCRPRVVERWPAIEGGENVLFILIDDVGLDKIGAFAGGKTPATPNIDALADEGVLFWQAYANPTCSPTRASLLTGRHASRTGIGTWIDPNDEATELSPAEPSIPKVLWDSPYGYHTGIVGKWHLTHWFRDDPGLHPLELGFGRHAGSLGNPRMGYTSTDTDRSYFHWEKNESGVLSYSDTYMTTDTTDEALRFIEDVPDPWFLWVAYNAAHLPDHVPPPELTTVEVSEESTSAELYDAATEALDTEIGRLLDGLSPDTRARTLVILLGDNGTPAYALSDAFSASHGKGTVNEAGVRVPLIVSGPGVSTAGASSHALVHAVDLLPTVAAIAGVDLDRVVDEAGAPEVFDGVSFLGALEDPGSAGQRASVFTEGFEPNGFGARTRHDRLLSDGVWRYAREEQDGVVEESLRAYEAGGLEGGDNLIEASVTDVFLRGLLMEMSAAMDAQIAAFETGDQEALDLPGP